MKKLMHVLFLSCLKVTILIEKKMQFELSFIEKLQLRVHKSMCSACTNYEKQNYFIEKAINNFEDDASTKIDVDLSSLKNSIIQKVENK